MQEYIELERPEKIFSIIGNHFKSSLVDVEDEKTVG